MSVKGDIGTVGITDFATVGDFLVWTHEINIQSKEVDLRLLPFFIRSAKHPQFCLLNVNFIRNIIPFFSSFLYLYFYLAFDNAVIGI